MKIFLSFAAGLAAVVAMTVNAKAQEVEQTEPIVRALVRQFDSAAVERRSAVLSSFVTPAGPKRTPQGEIVRLPAVAFGSLRRVDPPANNHAQAVWSKNVRQFARLFSIGEMQVSSDTAVVDVYVQTPLSTGQLTTSGLSHMKYTLTRDGANWRVVKIQPILSTTIVDGN